MKRAYVKKLKPAWSDKRGKIFDVLDGENIRHVGFIVSKKGAVRGNHYHKTETQYTFILKGKVMWVTRDMRKKAARKESHILGPGALAIDAPFVAHALVALEDTEFVFFTDKKRFGNKAYEKDTFRVALAEEKK